MELQRLVDYFAVVGYDFNSENKDPALKGKVLTRVPEQDWKHCPFTQGIELFCQPAGWYISHEHQAPSFFVSVLTDEQGTQQYCAILCFSEPLRTHSLENKSHGNARQGNSIASTDVSSPQHISKTSATGDSKEIETRGDDFIDEDMCKVDTGNGEDVETEPTEEKLKSTYTRKCLVLLSRIKDFRVLKNCLGLIYTVYIEGLSMSIENIIAKMLSIKVPPPGSPMLRFSIGAADKQALQTPQSKHLPVTRSSVAMLLRQLGILNVLNILCAALIDQKLLFYSCSYVRLTEACNALTALMYPFKYSYPYIPILPRHLLECTSSPTPFLIGVHSSFKQDLHELLDVVTVDLDGGVILIPECVNIPVIPEPYYTGVVEALTKVLCPDLVVADYAYPPEQVKSSEPERLDKEIRAIFLRLFCQLLMGYRSCLQVCRIHPKPIIRFQKDQYLLMRDFEVTNASSANEFVPKLLESQAFSLFIQENGPPYRKLHTFDEVVCETPERVQTDIKNVYKALKHIKELASDLYLNENPNHLPITEKIPKPSEGSHNRYNQTCFPELSVTAIQTFMKDAQSKSERERPIKRTTPCKRVPEGTRPISFANNFGNLTTSSRRLEVLKSCLSFIFESKTLEIKKIFQAVVRALKSRTVRYALSQQLATYAKTNAQLDNQQFDYISRLVNSALQDSSGQLDEYTLAADILPVVTSFNRKLGPTVTQFMYTVVQDHPVWSSSGFWEKAFYDDIQDEIYHLYKASKTTNGHETSLSKKHLRAHAITSLSNNINTDATFKSDAGSTLSGKVPAVQSETHCRRDNHLCMEIAANQLQQWEVKSSEEQQEMSVAEEGVVFSQAMHNAQRMVFMLVPLDSSRINRTKFLRFNAGEETSTTSYFTGSLTGSMNGSMDEEPGYEDIQEGDISSAVTKFVSKFVDRACTEAAISNEHTKMLLNRIQSLVHMQVESLLDVYRESKRLPPIMKPKLLQPKLLLGEVMFIEKPLRAYLATDGRGTATGSEIGGPVLLPAEGALFVTSYRVVFIGTPCDALAAEQVVIRSFPISCLYKIKTFNVHDFHHLSNMDNSIQCGVQLRSSTFQLLLLAFDEEVSTEQQEKLRQQLHALRYPSTIEDAFAVSSAWRTRYAATEKGSNIVLKSRTDSSGTMTNTLTNQSVSSAKTFYKQAKRKVGLNKTNRFSRLVMPDSKSRTLYYPAMSQSSTSTMNRLPDIDEAMTKTLSDKDTISRLFKRSCESDYKRMRLISVDNKNFRLSRVNRMFAICRSYPACAVVPAAVSDEQIRSLSHCHHQGRFPSVVWMHSTTNAILLRSSAIRSRTTSSLFKHGQSMPMLSDEGTPGSSSEEERFLLRIASLVNFPSRRVSTLFSSDSTYSYTGDESYSKSPDGLNRRGTGVGSSNSMRITKHKKWGTLTKSNGKSEPEHVNRSPMVGLRSSSAQFSSRGISNGTLAQNIMHNHMTRQAQLYVLGDKAQLKNMKHEQQGKVLFVAIELPEPKHVRTSFKTLLKSCLPIDPPATVAVNSSQQLQDVCYGYLKGVEDSQWLEQVSQLILAAGTVVDLMDIHGASVMLAMEDGIDSVSQLSSLAQVLMDPHYRTIGGFQTLIQKEWLSFGHRFSHRNRFNDVQSSGFTPVFLQFIDAVYQVHRQFPMSFEFNSFYLEVIAYHSVSNRFNTFLLDSDFERLEAGILFEKKLTRTRSPEKTAATSRSSSSRSPRVSPVHQKKPIKSLWEYVDAAHKRSPVFLNSFYRPNNLSAQVLRPVSALCRLHVWPYYLRESLGEGPAYDGLLSELTTGASQSEQATAETSEAWGGATGRRIVNACYDNIADAQADSIKMLLHRVESLQAELGVPAQSWKSLWKSLNKSTSFMGEMPETTKQARNEIRSLHKKLTVDLIQKRTVTREESLALEKEAIGRSHLDTLPTIEDNLDTVSLYEQFHTNVVEVRTYEGSLWKQGAYMKAWKLRFFVLDTTKHELRQYENRGDTVCKNIIDLKDLESVQNIESVSSAPKGSSDKAYFEVKVSKRLYHFIAENEQAAKDWVDNLQAALQ